MSQHPNARLTPRGREPLVSRIESGTGVTEAARQMGVSRQTASKWLARSRRGEGLRDRYAGPLSVMTRSTPTPSPLEERQHPLHERAGRGPPLVGQQPRVGHPAVVVDGHVQARRPRPGRRAAAAPERPVPAAPGYARDLLHIDVDELAGPLPLVAHHSACGGLLPMSRIVGVNNVLVCNN